MSSRFRTLLFTLTALVLIGSTIALSSGSAHADGISITLIGSSPVTTTYPNPPAITLEVSSGSTTVPTGPISLTLGTQLAATGNLDSSGRATLRPIDQSLGYLPIGSHEFIAHFGDTDSAIIPATVTTGLVNLGFTSVTDNNDGTANFAFTISAVGTSTTEITRPSGYVALEQDGAVLNYVFVGDNSPMAFNNVPFANAPVAYVLRFLGGDTYDEKLSSAFHKGDTIVTTTTTTSTSTTTSTTVPATTTSTTSATTPNTPSNTTTTTTPPDSTTPTTPATTKPQGYRLVENDGTVRNYGIDAFGDASKLKLNAPIISAAHTPSDNGYWLLGADGGIFTFGDAQFFGSMGGKPLNKPIVGLAPTASGNGYWLVASDGGVFAYGDAAFYGSIGGKPLNKPIVGITAAADGKGYRMVASDGGIFSFGSAAFYGSMGGKSLNKPVVGMTATPDSNGYWLVASDGGIFAYGNAGFFGSTGSLNLNKPIVAMRSTPSGAGYWFVASDGGVFAYGDATFAGSAASSNKTSATVALS